MLLLISSTTSFPFLVSVLFSSMSSSMHGAVAGYCTCVALLSAKSKKKKKRFTKLSIFLAFFGNMRTSCCFY